jgi:hypothetical protein
MKTRCQSLALRIALKYAEQITIFWNLDDASACNFDYFPNERILIKTNDCAYVPNGGDEFLTKNLHERKHTWVPGFNTQLKRRERHLVLFVGQTSINRFTHEERRQPTDGVWRWFLEQIISCEQSYRAYYRQFPPPDFWHHKRWSVAYKEGEAQNAEWQKQRQASFNRYIHPPLLGALGVLIQEFGDCSSYTVFGSLADKNEYVKWRLRNINHHSRKLQNQKLLEADVSREWPSIVAQLTPHFRSGDWQIKTIERAVAKGKLSTRGARAWFKKQHILNRLNDGIKARKTQQPIEEIAA